MIAEYEMKLRASDKTPDMGGWKARHDSAIVLARPTGMCRPFETPIAGMLHLWAQYAADHKKEYDAQIGDDYVLGPAWEELGDSIRTLLNGQTGRLDCGTLDAFILDTMSKNGVDTSEK